MRLALTAVTNNEVETRIEIVSDNEILVVGIEAAQIGHIALREQVELHELTPIGNDLEALFLELTAGGNPGGAA